MSLTPEKTILDRLMAGEEHMKNYTLKVKNAAKRFRDASGATLRQDDDGGRAKDQPIGEVNRIAINIRLKAASIAFATPDFAVTCNDPANVEPSRAYLRDKWRDHRWARLTRRSLLFRMFGSMGFAAGIWDGAQGFLLEHVHPKDLMYDPHTLDETWNMPRYAGRRIYLPREEAKKRYGSKAVMGPNSDPTRLSTSDQGIIGVKPEQDAVEVKVYWDGDTEAEAIGRNIQGRVKNRYGRVPIHVLQGDLNPEGEFSLGDMDQSLGIYEMTRQIGNIINSAAKNGGGQAWARSDYIDEGQRDAFLGGEAAELLLCTGAPGDQVVGWTKYQELQPAILEALAILNAGLDSDQGVTDLDRGVITPGQNPKFASQSMLMAQRSNSRGAIVRSEYEFFCEDLVRECIRQTVAFGLDPRAGNVSPEAIATWQALKDVKDVRVIEESASWKDPGAELTAAMQLLELIARLAPVLLQQAMMGISDRLPVLTAFVDDVLRVSRRNRPERYWMQMTPEIEQKLAQAASPQQAQKPPKSPIETLAYKDAPPDVQRQIEGQAGLQPSHMGGVPPQAHEAGMAAMDHEAQLAQQHQQIAANMVQHHAKIGADLAKHQTDSQLKLADLQTRSQEKTTAGNGAK